MSTHNHIERPPFAAQTDKIDKRHAGRTDASHTRLDLRSHGTEINDELRDWVYERTGRQLGKFATQIERIVVRFGDENGPKGGVDRSCTIEISVSSLPNVVVTERGETDREAFDRAAGRAERATRRSLERHGFSAKGAKQRDSGYPAAAVDASDGSDMADMSDDELDVFEAPESLIGARVGHGPDNLMDAVRRPEKERRDVPVDTAQPDTSADDRKAGGEHTARRNSKLNTAGMSVALEDSTNGQPSRKSTRRSTNRIKPDNPLTRTTKDAMQSPHSKADRARARNT